MAEGKDEFARLLALAKRDKEALEQLIRLYEADLRIVARVKLGTALRPYLDSMDMVQSVHKDLIRQLHNEEFVVASAERLKSLVVRILHRKIAHKWRHHRRQMRLERGHSGRQSIQELLQSLCDSGSDPRRSAERRDLLSRIYRELEELDRRLIELRLDGYSTKEAAELMNQKPEHLRMRLSRLRKRLENEGFMADWL